jgi:hypothetical protein
VLSVEEASVRGHFRTLEPYPVLEVPEEDVLAHGSADPDRDVIEQVRAAARLIGCIGWSPMGAKAPPERHHASDPELVRGEILNFDDPAERLPALDRLEGFRPGGESLYRRVLVRTLRRKNEPPEVAWVYVGETALEMG